MKLMISGLLSFSLIFSVSALGSDRLEGDLPGSLRPLEGAFKLIEEQADEPGTCPLSVLAIYREPQGFDLLNARQDGSSETFYRFIAINEPEQVERVGEGQPIAIYRTITALENLVLLEKQNFTHFREGTSRISDTSWTVSGAATAVFERSSVSKQGRRSTTTRIFCQYSRQ